MRASPRKRHTRRAQTGQELSASENGAPQGFDPAASEVARAFNRTTSFSEEVLHENERLRYRNLHLLQELAQWRQQYRALSGRKPTAETEQLRHEIEEIRTQFAALRCENDNFRQRFQEIELQNENLLNLYVSGFQLHSTLDEGAVLAIIKEILLNLVGADIFGLWLLDPTQGRMALAEVVDETGCFQSKAPEIPPEAWLAVRKGEQWFAAPGSAASASPLCCIPLRVDEQTAGVLAIYRLLVQKSGFTPLDLEILGLLAAQAAATIIGARTFTQSGADLGWPPGQGA
jgi:FtsZ-binding cell division protein ZapB